MLFSVLFTNFHDQNLFVHFLFLKKLNKTPNLSIIVLSKFLINLLVSYILYNNDNNRCAVAVDTEFKNFFRLNISHCRVSNPSMI